jgi:hypothetical protein
MQKTIYYIIIGFLIITTLAIYRFSSQKTETKAGLNCSILKDIVDSEEYTAYMGGKVFPESLLTEIAFSDEINKNLLTEFSSSLVVCTLFSTLSCNICLDSEMKKVEDFNNYVYEHNLPISVIGIAHASNKNILLRFKRSSGFTFPLYLDDDNKINNHFKLKNFPMTLLIHTPTMAILAANHPVKDFLGWSDHFFTYCRRLSNTRLVAK